MYQFFFTIATFARHFLSSKSNISIKLTKLYLIIYQKKSGDIDIEIKIENFSIPKFNASIG